MTTDQTAELASSYDPTEAETKWYPIWEKEGYFAPAEDTGQETYTIVIPPPNVTGALHMGHALTVTLQDMLIRWRRMQGKRTLWLPGTDHAGIATQMVVERALQAEEGKTRYDLGREAFIRPVARQAEGGATFTALPDDQFVARQEKTGFYGYLEEGRVCIDARAIVGIAV